MERELFHGQFSNITIRKYALEFCSLSSMLTVELHSQPGVLVSAGTEVIFSVLSGMMLCFGSRKKPLLTVNFIQRYFNRLSYLNSSLWIKTERNDIVTINR